VRLDLTVRSALDRNRVSYPASVLALATADGSLTRGEHFLVGPDETESRLEVGPGEGVQSTVVFEVADQVDLSSASFTIDARDEEPAVLPLSGDIPALPYPREGTASGRSGPIQDEAAYKQTVIVEARTARATLDHAELRAPRDMMLVIVGVRVTATQGTWATGVGPSFFRLHVGDDVVPVLGRSSRYDFDLGNPGAWTNVELAFPVPVDATDMTLSAGRDGREDATFPVSVPPVG
jgi:hypothetical protein